MRLVKVPVHCYIEVWIRSNVDQNIQFTDPDPNGIRTVYTVFKVKLYIYIALLGAHLVWYYLVVLRY